LPESFSREESPEQAATAAPGFDWRKRYGSRSANRWTAGRGVMPSGTVKWFNAQKGYGFIQPEDGSKDVFVHITAVERAGLSGLNDGQKISFDVEVGQRGRTSAVNLKVT
jgi:CspA family cold shock protein